MTDTALTADHTPQPAAADDPPPPAAATSPAAAGEGPRPFLEGKFALYATPEGGVVIAYKTEGSTESKQLLIPPFILTMAGQASGLDPAQIMERLKSGDVDG